MGLLVVVRKFSNLDCAQTRFLVIWSARRTPAFSHCVTKAPRLNSVKLTDISLGSAAQYNINNWATPIWIAYSYW